MVGVAARRDMYLGASLLGEASGGGSSLLPLPHMKVDVSQSSSTLNAVGGMKSTCLVTFSRPIRVTPHHQQPSLSAPPSAAALVTVLEVFFPEAYPAASCVWNIASVQQHVMRQQNQNQNHHVAHNYQQTAASADPFHLATMHGSQSDVNPPSVPHAALFMLPASALQGMQAHMAAVPATRCHRGNRGLADDPVVLLSAQRLSVQKPCGNFPDDVCFFAHWWGSIHVDVESLVPFPSPSSFVSMAASSLISASQPHTPLLLAAHNPSPFLALPGGGGPTGPNALICGGTNAPKSLHGHQSHHPSASSAAAVSVPKASAAPLPPRCTSFSAAFLPNGQVALWNFTTGLSQLGLRRVFSAVGGLPAAGVSSARSERCVTLEGAVESRAMTPAPYSVASAASAVSGGNLPIAAICSKISLVGPLPRKLHSQLGGPPGGGGGGVSGPVTNQSFTMLSASSSSLGPHGGAATLPAPHNQPCFSMGSATMSSRICSNGSMFLHGAGVDGCAPSSAGGLLLPPLASMVPVGLLSQLCLQRRIATDPSAAGIVLALSLLEHHAALADRLFASTGAPKAEIASIFTSIAALLRGTVKQQRVQARCNFAKTLFVTSLLAPALQSALRRLTCELRQPLWAAVLVLSIVLPLQQTSDKLSLAVVRGRSGRECSAAALPTSSNHHTGSGGGSIGGGFSAELVLSSISALTAFAPVVYLSRLYDVMGDVVHVQMLRPTLQIIWDIGVGLRWSSPQNTSVPLRRPEDGGTSQLSILHSTAYVASTPVLPHAPLSQCAVCLAALVHPRPPPTQSGASNGATRGFVVQCLLCGHGGHVEHIEQWWAQASLAGSMNAGCPAGCPCLCQY